MKRLDNILFYFVMVVLLAVVGGLTYMMIILAVNFSSKAPPSQVQPSHSVLDRDPAGYDINDMSKVVTLGNSSYIPLNINGTSDEHHHLLLEVLQRFRELHPEWEVELRTITEIPRYSGANPSVQGIWVDHTPKTVPAEKPM